MVTKGLETILKQHNGKDAVISISHKLYGDQKIQCKWDYIQDDQRLGFCVKSGQEIYVYRNEIQNVCIGEEICFADDVMQVNVQFK